MTTSSSSEQIALTGSDCLLRAFNAQIERHNDASHVAQLILQLGPGFDVDRFCKHVEQVVQCNPILRAPIARRYGIGAPFYDLRRAERCPLPQIALHRGAAQPDGDQMSSIFAERLNHRFDGRRGRLLCFDIAQSDSGERTDLALTWLHMLFDGSGSEKFVRWLDETYRGVRPIERIAITPEALPAPPGGEKRPATRKELGVMAMRWQAAWWSSSRRRPGSLGGPLRRMRQELRYSVDTLSQAETAAALARAREKAGVLTPMLFYLACSLRAHDAVFRSRGVDPGCFVVPVPVNLRPKGQQGDIFGSHVSPIWFRVARESVGELDGLIEELKAQRRDAIKNGMIDAGLAALDYARYMPALPYASMVRRSTGGTMCSFFFAYTDQFLAGVDSLFGAELRNGFHTPSVPVSPGSCAVFSVRAGRLNVTHVYQHGALSESERALLRAHLLRELRGS